MRTRKLSSARDFDEFATRYRALTPWGIDAATLAASHARGLFDDADRMVGGYRITLGPNLPSLAAADTDENLLGDRAPEDCADCGALWLLDEVTADARRLLYSWIWVDHLALGRRWLLGAGVRDEVVRQQLRALPEWLYEGPGHNNGHPVHMCLYVGDRDTAWRDLVASGAPAPWPFS